MRAFANSVIFVLLASLGFCWGDAAINVRERHDTAVYVNIPFDPSELSVLVPPPLQLDVYNGRAWATLLFDNLDKLEYYTFLGYIDTHSSGYETKINLLVTNTKTGKRGYMLYSIDFQDNANGWWRSAGAILTQKIKSYVCSYQFNLASTNTSVNIDYRCKDEGTYTTVSASLKQATSKSDLEFAYFVANRTTKYLAQNNGHVQYADETGVGAQYVFDPIYVFDNSKPLTINTNVPQHRFGVPADSTLNICDNGTCFLQPYYILVDHQNQDV